MSRRHPLSSIRAESIHRSRHRPLMTLPTSNCRQSVRRSLTSSSWRPCGSSWQSSSLPTSPSWLSPSSLSWPCCPPELVRWLLVGACTRESKCTSIRIHQHIEKNSVPLKEVLTQRLRHNNSVLRNEAKTRRRGDANNPRKFYVDVCQGCQKWLRRSDILHSTNERSTATAHRAESHGRIENAARGL